MNKKIVQQIFLLSIIIGSAGIFLFQIRQNEASQANLINIEKLSQATLTKSALLPRDSSDSKSSSTLTVTAPIILEKNSDISSYVGIISSGIGTIADPYVFDSLQIKNNSAVSLNYKGWPQRGVGVYLGPAFNKSVIIKNCYIEGFWRGIVLEKQDNQQIINNSIRATFNMGILLNTSNNCNISTNSISNSTGTGIMVYNYAQNNLISYNTITDIFESPIIANTPQTNFYPNPWEDEFATDWVDTKYYRLYPHYDHEDFQYSWGMGVWNYLYSKGNNISFNIIQNVDYHLISNLDSDEVNIHNNTLISGKLFAIQVRYSNNVNLSYNYVIRNPHRSIGLFTASNIIITSNILDNNGDVGIGIYGDCDYNIISYNIITNTYIKSNEITGSGIGFAGPTDNNLIYGNLIQDNEGVGVKFGLVKTVPKYNVLGKNNSIYQNSFIRNDLGPYSITDQYFLKDTNNNFYDNEIILVFPTLFQKNWLGLSFIIGIICCLICVFLLQAQFRKKGIRSTHFKMTFYLGILLIILFILFFLFEYFKYLFISAPIMDAAVPFFMTLTATAIFITSESAQRDTISTKKSIGLSVILTAFFCVNIIYNLGVPSLIMVKDLMPVILYVISALWLGQYFIRMYRHMPDRYRVARNYYKMCSILIIITSFCFMIAGIGNIWAIKPITEYNRVMSIAIILNGICFLLLGIVTRKNPELGFILQLKAHRITIIESDSGIPIFDHQWKKKKLIQTNIMEDSETIYSGMIQGIRNFIQESLKSGIMEEIKMKNGQLILSASEKYPIIYVIFTEKTTRGLRIALNAFVETFEKQFITDTTNYTDISQFRATDKLIQQFFPFQE
jgi:parallel beta-helix repeat protein